MSTAQTLHKLVDEMESKYTLEVDSLASKLEEKERTLEEEQKRFESLEKQYHSIIHELESKLDKIKNELFSCKSQSEQEIRSFKNVSILNQYLKEIDQLKNDNSILTKRLDSTKKLLDESQKENKYFKELKKGLVSNSDAISQTTEEAVEVEEAEEAEETVEEEEAEKAEEPIEEIDVSKLDIIEVDDVEYYLDLDNNIRDKETLEVVGTITDDGDAKFYS
jgi:S-DNA-T family DNA segregation ATPase FtsK/SpoIIIE